MAVAVCVALYVCNTGAGDMCRHRRPPLRQRPQHYGERGLRLPLLARQVASQYCSRAACRMDLCTTPPVRYSAQRARAIRPRATVSPVSPDEPLVTQVVPGAQRACAEQGLRCTSLCPHPSRPFRAAPTVSSIQPHAQLHPLHSSTWGGGAVCPKRPGGAQRACTCANSRYDGLRTPQAQQGVLSELPSLIG